MDDSWMVPARKPGSQGNIVRYISICKRRPSYAKKLLDMGYVSTDNPASLWLSLMQKREMTRQEDEAYALFGLLKLDFQIMYGEGQQAWTRLIEQVAIQLGNLSWMMRGNQDHNDTKCYIPHQVWDKNIAQDISDYPIGLSLSYLGMEIYIVAFAGNNASDYAIQMEKFYAYHPYGALMCTNIMAVSGTHVVLSIVFQTNTRGKVAAAFLMRYIKPVGEPKLVWIMSLPRDENLWSCS
jgi:hypothetical protein